MSMLMSDQSHSVFVHSAMNLLFAKFSACKYVFNTTDPKIKLHNEDTDSKLICNTDSDAYENTESQENYYHYDGEQQPSAPLP
jgi:hypothetical protein